MDASENGRDVENDATMPTMGGSEDDLAIRELALE